jgi:hypothetical protein
MRKAMSALALVAAAGLLVVQTASAQSMRGSASSARPLQFGAQVNWATDTDFGLGARAVYSSLGQAVGLSGLEGVASLDFFFPGSGVTYFEVNADVTYPLRIASAPTISPYVGGGLNVAHSSASGVGGSTDVGLNLLGGTRFGLGSLKAFGEGRLELRSGSQFVLTFGVLF